MSTQWEVSPVHGGVFLSPFLWKNKEEMERSLLDTHRSAKTSVGFAGGSKRVRSEALSEQESCGILAPPAPWLSCPADEITGTTRVGSCLSLSVAAPAIAGCRVGSGHRNSAPRRAAPATDPGSPPALEAEVRDPGVGGVLPPVASLLSGQTLPVSL